MSERKNRPRYRLLRLLRTHFLSGLLIIVPIGLTVLILVWLFTSVDNILQPVVKSIFGHTIPGVGFGVIVVVIYLAGLITSNLVGKRLQRWVENYTVSRIPLVRPLYQGIRQILESFSSPGKSVFLSVVLVEFPRKGVKSIGFVTNETKDKNGEKLFHVFIPHAPNPITGFVLIVKETELEPTNMSVEDAVKMIVSAGKFIPDSNKAPSREEDKPE